jgi:hypothetical protein
VVLYLAAMAFFLALDSREFAELGMKGVSPIEVVRSSYEQRATSTDQMQLIRSTRKNLEDLESRFNKTVEALNSQENSSRD